mmetsp:Transcript_24032/g.42806  ORF Transcript_24032/g.42806 Transcript_24032/m.42806 type:complete len:245 (+) Transcript_24032:241-975(+)
MAAPALTIASLNWSGYPCCSRSLMVTRAFSRLLAASTASSSTTGSPRARRTGCKYAASSSPRSRSPSLRGLAFSALASARALSAASLAAFLASSSAFSAATSSLAGSATASPSLRAMASPSPSPPSPSASARASALASLLASSAAAAFSASLASSASIAAASSASAAASAASAFASRRRSAMAWVDSRRELFIVETSEESVLPSNVCTPEVVVSFATSSRSDELSTERIVSLNALAPRDMGSTP